MAQLTLTIPNNKLTEIVEAFAGEFGYQSEINGNPNPQTKQEFARQQLIKFIRDVYRSHEIKGITNSTIDLVDSKTANLNIT